MPHARYFYILQALVNVHTQGGYDAWVVRTKNSKLGGLRETLWKEVSFGSTV